MGRFGALCLYCSSIGNDGLIGFWFGCNCWIDVRAFVAVLVVGVLIMWSGGILGCNFCLLLEGFGPRGLWFIWGWGGGYMWAL